MAFCVPSVYIHLYGYEVDPNNLFQLFFVSIVCSGAAHVWIVKSLAGSCDAYRCDVPRDVNDGSNDLLS